MIRLVTQATPALLSSSFTFFNMTARPGVGDVESMTCEGSARKSRGLNSADLREFDVAAMQACNVRRMIIDKIAKCLFHALSTVRTIYKASRA
jgi:hypothetical protein